MIYLTVNVESICWVNSHSTFHSRARTKFQIFGFNALILSYGSGASKNAEGLFQDVLARKDDADRTRNALNVLQRFRFLFSLPQSIERNIQLVCGLC